MENIYKDKYKKSMIEFLGGRCVKCGSIDNLEFDHIIRSSKKFCVGGNLGLVRGRLKEELLKCQLLCHDCHLKKTNKELSRGVPVHGTISTYNNYKCKCTKCRRAWADYMRHKMAVYRQAS